MKRYNVVHKVKEVLMANPSKSYSLEDLISAVGLSKYEIKYALTYIEDSEFPHYAEITGRRKLKDRLWQYAVPGQVLEAEARAAIAEKLLIDMVEVQNKVHAFLSTHNREVLKLK
jgi:predicted restriction endonuclease